MAGNVITSLRRAPSGGPNRPLEGALLEVKGVTQSFGGLVALDNVGFAVLPGQIKAIIGPNGAGKTTLFNAISGILPPAAGTITFERTSLVGLRPYQIGCLGVSRTFQNLSLFPNMTVLENVMVGAHCRTHCGMLAAALRLRRQRLEERTIHESARGHLDAVGLGDAAELSVGELPFGRRRLVELARALATRPRLLLLDEPASGLNTKETEDLARTILGIRDRGITVLLVEHDMSLVMDISDSILVLDFGKLVADGSPADVRNDKQVIAVYLGGDFDGASH